MKVKKDSWHYNLVKHKEFIANLGLNNSKAMSYLVAVWLMIFIEYIIIPVSVLLLVLFFLGKLKVIAFIIITLACISPATFAIIATVVEPFIKKEWRKLEITD